MRISLRILTRQALLSDALRAVVFGLAVGETKNQKICGGTAHVRATPRFAFIRAKTLILNARLYNIYKKFLIILVERSY